MRIPRIYQAGKFATHALLDESAARHLISVLRLSEGDKLILFNGDGLEYPAIMTKVKKSKVEVEISSAIPNTKNLESPLKIYLGQGISKGERMDLTLQKATELGVTSITPIFSARTEVHLKGEREIKKCQHWEKVIISSCEQCGRNIVPILHTPIHIYEWIKNTGPGSKILLDHESTIGFKELDLENPVYLLAGPEGGFSLEEKDYAKAHQFIGVSLGPRVLRTETAALAAISTLQILKGDF
jgi:16S rRNA (uracil1498-N3)-methyltransferase